MTSTAPMTIILPVLVISKKLLSARNGISVWSTSTTPSNGSRSGPPSTAAVFAPAAKPCCREPKLPLQLLRRHAVGVGGHQVSGPEPYCQRQLCPVHHRPSRHRCLSTAGDTLMGISSALQQAGPRPAAFGATKAIRPAALEQEPSANSLHPESAVEIRGARAASWPWRRIMTARPPRISVTWDNAISLRNRVASWRTQAMWSS